MLVLPLIARFLAPLTPVIESRDVGADVELTIDLGRASWIELVAPDSKSGTDPRFVSASLFQNNIYGTFRSFYPGQSEFLDRIARPGIALVSPGGTELAFVVADVRDLKGPASKVVLRGRRHESESYYSPCFVENAVELPANAR